MSRYSLTISIFALSGFLLFMGACSGDSGSQVNQPSEQNNTSPNGSQCTDKCQEGERICKDDSTVLRCLRQAQGCFDFGEPSTCPGTKVCESGSCIDRVKTCNNLCLLGDAPRCNVAGDVETCADHNNDGCTTYEKSATCGAREVCNAEQGKCVRVSCENECNPGHTRCDNGRVQTCVEDTFGCRAYSAGELCPAGTMCVNGACRPSSSCENECVNNEGVCTMDGQVRICGHFDDSGCMTLSDSIDCFDHEVCVKGDCDLKPVCVNTCIKDTKLCMGNKIVTCADHNNNGCVSFDAPQACSNPEHTCLAGQSSAAACGAVPVSGVVFLNEIFYDPLGPDMRGTGDSATSPTFIELYGTPGRSIAGYVVEMISGSDGQIYNSATLPAGAALDGNGYAVLAMEQADDYLKNAVSYTNVYFVLPAYSADSDAIQNGPDSIILKNASAQEVDAVGYGNFGEFIVNFHGQGTPTPGATAGRSIGRAPGQAGTGDNSRDFKTYYPTPGLPNSDLLINEIYINQPGSNDGTETFVELMAPIVGWEDLPLDGYVLRAISGSSGQDYIYSSATIHGTRGISLSGLNLHDGAADAGYVVICHQAAVAPLRAQCSLHYDGVPFYAGPDNFVLEYQGEVVDAVGYGTFRAGQHFTGRERSVVYNSTHTGQSLGRWPIDDRSKKLNAGDNRVDFHRMTPSPGRLNERP